jgi:hypothetical protein
MNLDNIQRLREAVNANPHSFIMSHFYSLGYKGSEPVEEVREGFHCGTTLCVAGWCNLLRVEAEFQAQGDERKVHFGVHLSRTNEAADWLGIPRTTGDRIFHTYWPDSLPEGERLKAFNAMLDALIEGDDDPWETIRPDFD